MYRLFPLRKILAPIPAQNFEEAQARFALLQAAEGDKLAPYCRTTLLTHGKRTPQAIVLIHGFTNCPYQFQKLAPLLHARGHNVLNLRLPGHGYADRLTTQLIEMTEGALIDSTTNAVDIACGLGEQVTVIGFSLGGVIAGWVAQQRPDVKGAVLISPAIGIQALPANRRRLYGHLLALLPNFYQWWHPSLKEQPVEPLHAYPRFASHALATLLRIGLIVRDSVGRSRPSARQVMVITNPSDRVVDNQTVAQVVAAWRAHGIAVTTHSFPAEWQLLHDLIDPLQPEQQVERVYPLLLEWLAEAGL